jgi:hypothetical protein
MKRFVLTAVGIAIGVIGPVSSIGGTIANSESKSSATEQPKTASGKATLTFPKIDRHPAASDWKRGTPTKATSLPHYNLKSRNPWQVDMRATDFSGLDLKKSLNDLLYATFDTRTVWPSADRMPKEYNRQQILKMGKNPGLGLRKLHAHGITGKGIGLAIIDQPLLVDHLEYKDRVRLYEEIHVEPNTVAQLHGAAVTSIAVGKTIGVAPEADLYYIGSWTGEVGKSGTFVFSFKYYAQAVRRILEINHQLPADRRIRVIAMQVGWTWMQAGYSEITAACKEAKAAGLFVVSSSLEEVHGFKFHGLGRSPLADPDQFESYEPGLFWANDFWQSSPFQSKFLSDRLLIPMDSRTLASFTGVNDYFFCRSGGWSWSIPYIAGVYALACQAEPKITPERFWKLALNTGRTIQLERDGKTVPFGPIIDPVALIDAVGKSSK